MVLIDYLSKFHQSETKIADVGMGWTTEHDENIIPLPQAIAMWRHKNESKK